jgi:membrane associated rhomboid family serine protease
MPQYSQQNRRKLTVGADGNALMNLMALLMMAFIIFAFIEVIYTFSYGKQGTVHYHDEIFPWVAMPANLHQLVRAPWTFLTHPFIHDGVWSILGNLLWLWAFGYIYQDMTGYRKLVPLFLMGSYVGAIVFLLTYNLIPGLHADLATAKAWGAGSGVMAVAIATTVLAADYRIFPMIRGGIPLWVITLVFGLASLASIPIRHTGEHLSLLAAAGFGYVFQLQQNKDRDWTAWMNKGWDWLTNLFNPDKHNGGKATKDQLFYKATVPPYQKQTNFSQQRVDEILEKIHQKGFKSLTEEERDILKRASKE